MQYTFGCPVWYNGHYKTILSGPGYFQISREITMIIPLLSANKNIYKKQGGISR